MSDQPDMAYVLEELRKAGQNMTEEQVRAQKISFVMGMLNSKSKITREEVAAHLDKMAGRRPAA